ncbi:hypothetical protein EXIGUO8H_20774 [Exiguobacterium sp. 8H]|nr:hypothetical protein EXIGUO8A_11841 [Exiguobacterium sp. 8A]VXB70069.1 hypothetical protein EXIGUO8H_20774 [Exiguobacterium sp. 8H]
MIGGMGVVEPLVRMNHQTYKWAKREGSAYWKDEENKIALRLTFNYFKKML